MKLIDADKLIEKLGDKILHLDHSKPDFMHNNDDAMFGYNQLHDKVTKIVEEGVVDLSKVIDVTKISELIWNTHVSNPSTETLSPSRSILLAQTITQNINRCLKESEAK